MTESQLETEIRRTLARRAGELVVPDWHPSSGTTARSGSAGGRGRAGWWIAALVIVAAAAAVPALQRLREGRAEVQPAAADGGVRELSGYKAFTADGAVGDLVAFSVLPERLGVDPTGFRASVGTMSRSLAAAGGDRCRASDLPVVDGLIATYAAAGGPAVAPLVTILVSRGSATQNLELYGAISARADCQLALSDANAEIPVVGGPAGTAARRRLSIRGPGDLRADAVLLRRDDLVLYAEVRDPGAVDIGQLVDELVTTYDGSE